MIGAHTLAAFAILAHSLIQDVPGIIGAIPSINKNQYDVTPYLKSRPSDFVYPGMWHTHEDLERIKTNVQAGKEPWKSAFDAFRVDTYSLSNYTMLGPKAVISRGLVSNYSTFSTGMRAAWQNALMWYITGDQAHAKLSTRILDSWGSNLTAIIGSDRSLLLGLDGDLFVNAADIMRHEAGWVETGSQWQGDSGFSIQLCWLFSRQSTAIGQANYGVASIKALLNFAVFLDDVQLWNYAMNELVNHPCAGLFASYHPETCQSVESGRDQSHAQSGIGWTAYAMRTAQSQGSDLFSLGNNLLLKGAEYSAKSNLNNTVPHDPNWYRCEAVLVGGPWEKISTNAFGITNRTPIWDLLHYEYTMKRNLSAPWTERARVAEGFEGAAKQPSINDHSSWGELLWAA
ncbi:chondroitin AC/alginate lyase [Setomelanomma holmii]|uniref:Chondroitin AC/alginate lyase n=1 Tax=Setomelanomma holmii TaxID=210430 RepID=A0A9P4HCR4_9PLEO|nr:chondroitin AC/alginate lyase [Setomelanomma holmii]